MDNVNIVHINGLPIAVPKKPQTTKFLIKMDQELRRDPFAMDRFVKSTVSEQDIWDSATVVPL